MVASILIVSPSFHGFLGWKQVTGALALAKVAISIPKLMNHSGKFKVIEK